MARQGWEPTTPIQVLYKTWAQTDLGDVSLEDWVSENAKRIKQAREKALAHNSEVVAKRKNWNKRAINREFEVGDEVLVRKPWMNLKLAESWDGPFTVTRKNSPLSYAIDTGGRKIPSVHIQLMKSCNRDEQNSIVKRVTSVFESDTPQDDILNRFSEANIVKRTLRDSQSSDIETILSDYNDVMTNKPGLTHLIEFEINTGDTPPIFQWAYNTPAAFKECIHKEIDWLLEKQYIRPSSSLWSSPIVTVHKPDGTARLCVDFKRFNEVTRQQPFLYLQLRRFWREWERPASSPNSIN